MAIHSYTSRRELEVYRFSLLVTLLVPLALLLLQVLLPHLVPALLILNLPLVAVIFFAVARRNPISGAVTGALIGLLEDALTGKPIGINGMAKAVIGYAASSIGLQVDVENIITRTLMAFLFSLLQSGLLFLINRVLLGMPGYKLLWLHELLRAVANTAVAIPLFVLLDRFKYRD